MTLKRPLGLSPVNNGIFLIVVTTIGQTNASSLSILLTKIKIILYQFKLCSKKVTHFIQSISCDILLNFLMNNTCKT